MAPPPAFRAKQRVARLDLVDAYADEVESYPPPAPRPEEPARPHPQKSASTTLTKAELISEVARATDLNKTQAKDALEALLATVVASLVAGEEVRLAGFGSFVPVNRAARSARNPRTGEVVSQKAHRTATFRASETLKIRSVD